MRTLRKQLLWLRWRFDPRHLWIDQRGEHLISCARHRYQLVKPSLILSGNESWRAVRERDDLPACELEYVAP